MRCFYFGGLAPSDFFIGVCCAAELHIVPTPPRSASSNARSRDPSGTTTGSYMKGFDPIAITIQGRIIESMGIIIIIELQPLRF